MEKHKIFFWTLISFVLGVVLRSFWEMPGIIEAFLAVLAIALFCAFYQNRWVTILALIILIFTLGVWRASLPLTEISSIEKTDQNYSGKAVVDKEPEKKETYQNVIFLTDDRKKILVRENLSSVIKYGDQFSINCQLTTVENKDLDFDYRMYLAKDKIYYLCQKAQLEKTDSGKANRTYGTILNLKNNLEAAVNKSLPYPYSALGSGLLFGGSGQLPKDLQKDFSRTGLTHIIAVSGFNVTIIAQYLIVIGIAIGLWRKQAFWFAISGVTLFVAMIGFPSSAVRAGVMGGLLLWAMKKGRLANSWNAIAAAGAVMLMINPLLLRWDIGFQLSFLATIGIVAFSPFWEKIALKKFPVNGVFEIIFLTLSAQTLVIPIIAYQFHTVSIISLLSNLLILPIIPLLMLLVFLVAVTGAIWPPLSAVFSLAAYFPLRYVIELVRFFSSLPFSSFEISSISFGIIIVWYVVFIFLIFWIKKRTIKNTFEL
jgi:competence protein ComEC